MIRFATPLGLALVALVAVRAGAATEPTSGPAPAPTAEPVPAAAPVHCQVPCGVYGDKLRIDLLLEDATTIEKAMQQITELGAADSPNYNQIVRWVNAKDDHAQKIQDQVAAYWLTQRIKAPGEDAGPEARARYDKQLRLMHGMTVQAMKCKQTTSASHPNALRQLITEFVPTYFSAEDLKHLQESHGLGGHDDHGDHDHDHDHGGDGR